MYVIHPLRINRRESTMFYIFYCIAPIFLLIAIGRIIKISLIRAEDFWRGAEKITYYIFFPALLINALASTKLQQDIHGVIQPLIMATMLVGTVAIMLRKIINIEKSRFTSYFQGVIRYNSYVFIGVSSAIYGKDSLPVVAIIIAYMIIVTNVFSVVILKLYASDKKPNPYDIIKGIFKNPLVISSLVGLALNKTPFLYPDILSVLFTFLGNAALPISLMCVGAGLKIGHLLTDVKSIALVNITKLLIFPALSLILMNLFHVPSGMTKNIALLYTALPCAGNAYILAQQMNGDHEIMAAIISTTTVISILTIPLILKLFLKF